MQYSTAKQLIKMMGKHHLVKLLEWMNEDALESAISLDLDWNIHDDFQYEGEYRNDKEFAQELLDSTGDIPDDREKESYQVERYEIQRSQKPTPISLWVRFCDSVEDFN